MARPRARLAGWAGHRYDLRPRESQGRPVFPGETAMSFLRGPRLAVKRMLKTAVGRDLFLREQVTVRRERHGSGYGGWWIHPDPLGPKSVVYSFGVGDDISFDLSVIEKFGVCVEAFDPTPRSVEWIRRQVLPQNFRFHPIGVADFDGDQEFHPPPRADHVSYSIQAVRGGRPGGDESVRVPVRRLSSIMTWLGLGRIDLLKLDIEGAEYPVIQDVLACRIPIQQILVEFHHGHRGIGAGATRDAVRRLDAAGYRIFSVSPSGGECSFLKMPGA